MLGEALIEGGYAAAQRLHEHRLDRGWRPVGRKIGFTNRNIWPLYGVYQPIWGYVYDRTLIAAEDGGAEVTLAGLLNPRIEPEICFGLKETPRSPEAKDLLQCIAWVAHIVTTGTLTDAHPVAPGELWRTEIAGLPLQGLRVGFS